MPTTAVITQSNYLPWRGYFDLFAKADVAVLLDSVQYTRRDWRNRNRIKTARGPIWLTVPVEVKGRYDQAIDETRIADAGFAAAHVRTIDLAYRQAAGYADTAPWLFAAMNAAGAEPLLAAVNERLLRAIAARLGVPAEIRRCCEFVPRDQSPGMEASERLIEICRAAGATRYVSGPTAKDYLDVAALNRAGITVEWMDYGGYAEYPQCWGGEFDPQLSIVDLLMNTGADAPRYLKGR